MTYVLAAALLASIGLNVVLGTAVISFGKAALSRADAAGVAGELAAQRVGEAELDARKVDDANAATMTAVAAEKKQEARGDGLEKELADADAARDPGGALARLRAQRAAEASADPGAGPHQTGSGG